MDGIVIKGCEVFRQGVFVSADVEILDGVVTRVEPGIVPGEGVSVCNFDNCLVVPGLVDVQDVYKRQGPVYEQLPPHALLARRGQLRDGDEQGPRPVRAGEAFERRRHHLPSAEGVEVYHVRARAAQHGHRPLHRVRYIAELEVEEYACLLYTSLARRSPPRGG